MMKKYTFDAKNGLWYEQCGEVSTSLAARRASKQK